MDKLRVALRFGVAFLANCFAALLGSDVLAHALGASLWRPHTITTVLVKAYIFAVVSAVIFGAMASSAWRTVSASWVWTAGLVLFVTKLIPMAGAPHLLRQVSGVACGDADAPLSCASTWVSSTIFPLRAFAYSAGAALATKYRVDLATIASGLLGVFNHRWQARSDGK